ncbi:hypothetical protein TNCV_1728621 [Trichonephila clavipes]|nr:hypothetical protein TNCV_1728621 [Trichonephila clavipes]
MEVPSYDQCYPAASAGVERRDNRNRWRDGQVCPDVGQGIVAPWARRRGRRGEEPCPGSRKLERRALVGTDWKRALKKRT